MVESAFNPINFYIFSFLFKPPARLTNVGDKNVDLDWP